MNSTSLDITPADGVGAYIDNFEITASTAQSAALRQALGEYGVLFFRNQDLTPERHIAFAESFGQINVNRFFPANAEHPQIAEVKKEPSQNKNIGGSWHTDHSYDEIPAMGSILVSRITPKTGGECGEKQSAGEGCGHEEVLEVVFTDCGGMGGKRLQKFVHR